MTLAPIRYLQKWSAAFPGETATTQRLPTHSDAAQRRASAIKNASRRCGIAAAEPDAAAPIVVPVVPAQPLLRLSIPELAVEPDPPPVRVLLVCCLLYTSPSPRD